MRVGLIGHPVAHSASPRMQDAAFAAVGLDWHYELWDTPLDELPERVRMIRERDDIAGANVTIPHKQNIIPLLDDISTHARAIGAVNTIIKTGAGTESTAAPSRQRLVGDNTDWLGFLADLRFHDVQPEALTRALVLGAGGSARGICYALGCSGAQVHVLNRTKAHAEQLVASLSGHLPPGRIRAGPLSAQAIDMLDDVELIVNCTSAGMSPNESTSPWPNEAKFPVGAILYDLVYKPRQTHLMHQASQAGLRVIGGLGMLAMQGAASFQFWTHIPDSRVADIMRKVLNEQA